MFKKVGLLMLLLSLVVVPSAFADPIFAVDTATLTQITTDVTAWATAILGIALTVFAYRWVRKMVGR